MDTIMMVAANDGINHETGYGREHEKKKASERHYIPLPPAYAIRQSQLDGSVFIVPDVSWAGTKCQTVTLQLRTATEVDTWPRTAASNEIR